MRNSLPSPLAGGAGGGPVRWCDTDPTPNPSRKREGDTRRSGVVEGASVPPRSTPLPLATNDSQLIEQTQNKSLASNHRRGPCGAMVKRTPSPFQEVDRAYPIRVKFVVPDRGMAALGLGSAVDDWLVANLGPKMWSWGPGQSSACRQASAYYFRRMEDARRFVAAFPQLELADGVAGPIDTTPVERKPQPGHVAGSGWKPRPPD